MNMELSCHLDTRNLQRAQALFLQHSKTNPAQSINKTALFVIRKTQQDTPFVSQGQIDTDMNVTTSPEVTLAGRLSKDKTKQHGTVNFQNRTPTAADVSAMNTAERIVLAKMHPTSRFNLLTGNRWAITPPDFGRGRQRATDSGTLFWKWVRDVAARMVKARHSSTHFLQQSWTAIIYKLLPHVPPSYRGGPIANNGKVLLTGEVEAARPGSALAVCKVTNTLGFQGPSKVLNEKHNDAAIGIMVPILQRVINQEFEGKMAYAAKQGWVEKRNDLSALGYLVRIN